MKSSGSGMEKAIFRGKAGKAVADSACAAVDREDVRAAVDQLRRGGVILYPTDTVWGIGCDATDAEAVSRVFAIKRRCDSKALISLVADEAMLDRWVKDIPEVAFELIEAAVRPLTVVYSHPSGLAPNLLADDGSAALRVASDTFCKALCRGLRRPVVSTSANISGCPAPGCFAEISPEIAAAVDYVCASGRDAAPSRRPSSVIMLGDGGTVRIIRP